MSYFSYIAFPREVDLSCLKSRKNLSKLDDSDELKIYQKNPNTKFKNVFKNRFIYELNAKFSIHEPDVAIADMNIDWILKGIEEYDSVIMTKEELVEQLEESREKAKKMDEKDIKRCRSQLYELVKLNTSPDEIVEIYTGLLIGDAPFDFGPPKEKRVLDLKEVKTSEQLDIYVDGLKIEIYKRE